MKLQGTFPDKYDNKIEVIINNKLKSGTDITIGCSGDDTEVKFSGDPLTIEENLDNTLDTLIMKSGKLELVTSINLCDYLFASSHDSVIITINKNGNCIFKGYVEPNVYSQDYAEHLVTLTINFTDFLSTLQYKKLSDGTNNSWNNCVAETNTRSFKEYFSKFGFFGFGTVWYDGSKKVFNPSSSSTYSNKELLSQIGVTDNLFLGDDEDSEMTGEDIIKEILQYLDLHIVQEGTNFYLFDWSTLKESTTHTFYNINDTTKTTTVDASNVKVTQEFYSDDSTQISIDDVYNQIKVKCDIDSVETIVESPLDKDSLSSFYPKKMKYCTEYFATGAGNTAHDSINDLLRKGYSVYDSSTINDWYMRPMLNSNWKFNISSSSLIQDIYPKKSTGDYYKQWYVGKYLGANNITSSIFSMGNVDYKKGIGSDDSPGKIDMSNYLYISLNGNEDDSENGHVPTDAQIQSHSPLIEYTGQNQAISLSPTDDTTINYIVFSGKMYYQPLQQESSSGNTRYGGTYYDCLKNGVRRTEHGSHGNVLKGTDNYGYYTRKFWTPDEPTENNSAPYMTSGINIGVPRNKFVTRAYKYNYSTTSDGNNSIDRYKKLPMIECEMTVGNKRLIETNIDQYGNSTFQWVTIGSEPTDKFGNKITTFSLGCNPKIEDYIIGTEFDMQNTVTTTMNLDTEGTAIPIRKSDALSGKISFKILGPINNTWNDITRRHPSFWRHTKWTQNTVFILAHCENLIIKDFACKIYSDNSGNEQDQDKDLIYMSDMTHSYINSKDDITMKINTLLTSDEAYKLGVKNSVNLSSAIDMTNNLPLYGISKNGVEDSVDANHKPEKFYVDAYYNEYNKPKVILSTQFKGNLNKFNRFSTFSFNYFDKKAFYPINVSYDLKEDTVNYKLKEGANFVFTPNVKMRFKYNENNPELTTYTDVTYNKYVDTTNHTTLALQSDYPNTEVTITVYAFSNGTANSVVINYLDDNVDHGRPNRVLTPHKPSDYFIFYWYDTYNDNNPHYKTESFTVTLPDTNEHTLRMYGFGYASNRGLMIKSISVKSMSTK